MKRRRGSKSQVGKGRASGKRKGRKGIERTSSMNSIPTETRITNSEEKTKGVKVSEREREKGKKEKNNREGEREGREMGRLTVSSDSRSSLFLGGELSVSS